MSCSTCPAAAACSTDVRHQHDDESSERSQKLMSANDDNAALTRTVSVTSGDVDWRPIHGDTSTLNCSSAPLSTAVTGPSTVTLRRGRTNFSVVYRQTTSQPAVSQSSTHGEHVEVSTHEMQSDVVDQQPGPVDCRRALAVLASRLDDHGRRRLVETNVDGRPVSKPKSASAAVDHDPDVAAASPAVSLSSKVRPVASSTTDTRCNDATAAWSDVNRLPDLQSNRSPMNIHDVKLVRAESKLPISTTTSNRSFAVSKKPSTFRKFLSSKLTNVVRRKQQKHD